MRLLVCTIIGLCKLLDTIKAFIIYSIHVFINNNDLLLLLLSNVIKKRGWKRRRQKEKMPVVYNRRKAFVPSLIPL
jgi:hypothetical protein